MGSTRPKSDLPRCSFDDMDVAGILIGMSDVAEVLQISRMEVWRRVRNGELIPDFQTTSGESLFLPQRIAKLIPPR